MCQNEFEKSKKSLQKFCSYECQHEWQKTVTNEANPRYKRTKVLCSNCNNEMFLVEANLKRYTEHFCCNECRQIWYANVWSQNPEWKLESKFRAANQLANKQIITNTKPQQIINSLLDKLDIKYQNEYVIAWYSIDNYLLDYDLAIEVMGDYWHCNPTTYSVVKQDIQKKRIPKDKSKHTYLLRKCGINVLYLWEKDIMNNIDLCELLVKQYIYNNGQLENYHSFNYEINENELQLKRNIITPYQDLNINILKNFYSVD